MRIAIVSHLCTVLDCRPVVLCGVPTPPGFSARCGITACSLPLPHAPSATAALPHPTPLCRVLSLRCALAHFLLQLAADPRAPVLFRCTTPAAGSGLDVAGLMPTLFLLKDALMQVILANSQCS